MYQTVHDVFVKLMQAELRLAEGRDKLEGFLTVTTHQWYLVLSGLCRA